MRSWQQAATAKDCLRQGRCLLASVTALCGRSNKAPPTPFPLHKPGGRLTPSPGWIWSLGYPPDNFIQAARGLCRKVAKPYAPRATAMTSLPAAAPSAISVSSLAARTLACCQGCCIHGQTQRVLLDQGRQLRLRLACGCGRRRLRAWSLAARTLAVARFRVPSAVTTLLVSVRRVLPRYWFSSCSAAVAWTSMALLQPHLECETDQSGFDVAASADICWACQPLSVGRWRRTPAEPLGLELCGSAT